MAENPELNRGGDYDSFVDWDKRLAAEGPFFRHLFEREGASSVIDVGAGSGRHAILFASWGCSVVAVDPDEGMLAQARENAILFASAVETGGGRLRIEQGGFGDLHRLGLGPVDAVTCTGNALPHVNGRDGLTEALADFAQVLTSGGVLVLHLLNHDRLLAKRPHSLPVKVVETSTGTRVFLRILDYPEGDEAIDIDFLRLERGADGEWEFSHRVSPHTALTVSTLESELSCAGFSRVEVFGGHDRHPLGDADESVLLVAHRA